MIDPDGRLPLARLAEDPFDADQVAEIEQVGECPALFAHLLLAGHDLDAAGLIVQLQEVDVPLVAAEDDAASGADPLGRIFIEGEARFGQNTGDGRVAIEPAAPRVEAERLNLAELFESAGVRVAGDGRIGSRRFGGHGYSLG